MRWLLKTEPTEYSFHDLLREERARWDGIRNALALRHLRRASAGDEVFVYHTADEKQVVGIARILTEPYPDPSAGDARLVVVDLAPGRLLPRPVTLAEMRAERGLQGFELLRFSRLSVVPVTDEQWETILRMSAMPAAEAESNGPARSPRKGTGRANSKETGGARVTAAAAPAAGGNRKSSATGSKAPAARSTRAGTARKESGSRSKRAAAGPRRPSRSKKPRSKKPR